MPRRLGHALPVILVAVVGHLPVLHSWWLHDDWIFLADAAGVVDRGGGLVRPVAYLAYWRLLYPLFGLVPWPWAVTRLALHAGSALLVGRLAERAGLDRRGGTAAALLFAASPIAFESLVWGTGAVELLGGLLVLAALERWLAPAPRARTAALALAAAAVLTKEAGLLLAPVFAWDLARRRQLASPAGAGVAALAVLSMAAVVMVFRDLGAAPDYGVNPGEAPRNLLVFGSWLLTPGPLLQPGTLHTVTGLVTGASAWALWAVAVRLVRPGRRRAAAAALALGLLGLVPVLVTGDHAVPRYLYFSYAGVCVTAALLVWPGRGPDNRTLALLTVLMLAAAVGGTRYQLDARHPSGRPLHRLVFKEEMSRVACRTILEAGVGPGDRVVFLADPATPKADRDLLRDVLGDDRAVRLLTGKETAAAWRDRLEPADRGSHVFLVRGLMLAPQGLAPAPEP
jgi:hypothetical protein